MAGSMEALIQHLVPTDEYNPDVSLLTVHVYKQVSNIKSNNVCIYDWFLNLIPLIFVFAENLCVCLSAQL
jgi:hypothetical protein